jgi:tetratricopeptide (TPR) repeat protein
VVKERFARALEFQRKGDLKQAEAEYRAVLEAAPKYAEAHANLGAVLMRMDRYEEAIEAYQTALRLAPQLKPVLLNIGIAHFRKSQYDKAVEVLADYLRSAPGSAQATQLIALALVELGRDEESLPNFEKVLEAAPNDPALLYALGLASLRLQKPMVSCIIKTLSEVPGGLPASHLMLGQALLKRHHFEKAIVELEAAARLKPDLRISRA